MLVTSQPERPEMPAQAIVKRMGMFSLSDSMAYKRNRQPQLRFALPAALTAFYFIPYQVP